MKICLLTDAWTPVWGGGQKHIWEVAQRLVSKYDCQVDVLVPRLSNDSDKTFAGLRILHLGPRFTFPNLFGRVLFLIFCLGYMVSHRYDVYHSHAYQMVLLPIVKLLRAESKIAYTVHGAPYKIAGGSFLNSTTLPIRIWQYLLKHGQFDLLMTVDTRTANFALIGNGVDVREFDNVQAKKDPKVFKILWVGRNDPTKGVEYLRMAIKRIKKRFPKTQLALVTGKTGNYLIREYKSSDLFILPSVSEGLPITLLEAMAAKLPVVVSDVGACRGIVEKAKAGIVVAPRDVDGLVKAIAKMITNKNRRILGINGYNYVKRHFLWDEVAKKTYEAYRSLVANGSARAAL